MATSEKSFVGRWKILHWSSCPSLPEGLVKVSKGTEMALLEIESPPGGENHTLKWFNTEDKLCTISNPPLTPDKDEFDDDEIQAGPTTIEIEDAPDSIPLRGGVCIKYLMVITLSDDVGEGNPGTIIAEAHPRPPLGEESSDGE
jgi:hypothetical protein